jgi:hypothetical protein
LRKFFWSNPREEAKSLNKHAIIELDRLNSNKISQVGLSKQINFFRTAIRAILIDPMAIGLVNEAGVRQFSMEIIGDRVLFYRQSAPRIHSTYGCRNNLQGPRTNTNFKHAFRPTFFLEENSSLKVFLCDS